MAEHRTEERVIEGEATEAIGEQAKAGQSNGRRNSGRRERDTDRIVEEVTNVFREALSKGVDSAETIGDNVRQILRGVGSGRDRSGRDNVVMVRVDDQSLDRINVLVDAGVMDSRSEAAAFLIGEGVKARQNLFDQIDEKVQQIRSVKDELRRMAGDVGEGAGKSGE